MTTEEQTHYQQTIDNVSLSDRTLTVGSRLMGQNQINEKTVSIPFIKIKRLTLQKGWLNAIVSIMG